MGEEEKRQYFREFLENSELEVEDEGEFISAVINEISYVKGSQMDLSCYYSQNCPEEWFKRLYTGYEDMLRARGKLDFDDMLVMCYELVFPEKGHPFRLAAEIPVYPGGRVPGYQPDSV